MSARFIGRGNGLVITCNHGDVALMERPVLDADGKQAYAKNGAPIYERVFPANCTEHILTGQIVRSAIRHYAGTVGWLTVDVDDKKRDFCATHAPIRKDWIKSRKAERKRVADEKKAAREKAKTDRRAAWLARRAEAKRKREEKAARREAKNP